MSYIGNTQQNQSFVPQVDFFSGNGVTTAFTLSRTPQSVYALEVVVANVVQNPSDAYTLSGNTITFTSAPPSGTNNIYVYYTSPNTQVVQPGQGTVGSAQIASGVNFTAGTITFADSSTLSSHANPQVTVYTSGSGTYTTPAGAKYLIVEMVGGGGGGGGSGGATSAGNGGAGGSGGNTTFSDMAANGGGGGQGSSLSNANGGSASLGSVTTGIAASGKPGTVNGNYNNALGVYSGGGFGMPTPLNGYGSGGSGGGAGATSVCVGAGGGSSGYVKALISSPNATYSYAVGAAGTAGAAGTNGAVGGVGGSGCLIVTAYF